MQPTQSEINEAYNHGFDTAKSGTGYHIPNRYMAPTLKAAWQRGYEGATRARVPYVDTCVEDGIRYQMQVRVF